MSTLLSSTVGRCNQALRDAFTHTGRTRSKKWYAVAPIAALVLAVACADETKHPAAPTPSIGVPEAPVFGVGVGNEGNGPGQCLTADTEDAGFINNVGDLNCTSEDVDIAFATITLYSINGAPFDTLEAGQSIACVPGDNIKAVTQAFIENNAQARYDLGLWINPAPSGDAKDGASCLHYNLIPNTGNSTTLETGGQGGTPDACGDVAAGVTVTVPLDTLNLTCPGGGATTLSIGACAAWQNGTTGGNDRVCPIPGVLPDSSSAFRQGTTPGTTAKCRCEPLVLPIDVKGVLRIVKQTLPDGAVQSFTFTPNYNSGTTFDLSDGQTNNSPPLSAGTYTVDETVPSGWTLGTRSCVITNTATPKAFTPTTNGISVALGAGEDVTCTFNNTRNPTLTVNKVCVPTTDNGLFDLRIDGAVAGTGDDAACGGTTGAVEQSIGAHTVSEVAGTGTNLDNYTSVIGGDCAADGSVTLAAGDAKVCTITNTRKPTLTVNKVCVPTTDAGLFNLRIDGATAGTGADAACGGTTGAVVTTVGAHTVSETAGTGTNLSDYVSVIGGDCASDGTVSLAAGDNKTCTITNTRNARLTVNKVCVPTSDNGLFNLQIDGGTAGTGANAACGGTTGAVVVAAGAHTVGETAGTGTNLASYTSVISGDCAADGSVSVAPGDNKTCTITNTRKPTLTVNKVCVPTTDNGLFDLRIDGSVAGSGDDAACGGTTGAVEVSIGAHTVSELAGTGTNLSNYNSAIGGDCASDGSVSLAAGENKTCTITNTRKPTLRVNKVCVPTTDNGLFDLRIDGSVAGTGDDAGCGGTTGFVEVSIGAHTVSELAGTGTDLSNYTSVIGGDCASDGSVSVGAGENKTCTITNTRKPTLRVNKACVPTTDNGLFDLRIDGSVAGTGDDASCGGTTGFVEVSVGAHTVSELAGTGTDLNNYTSVIGGDCASDGSVSLAAGENKTCTITNTRKPTIRVDKVCVPTTDPGAFNLQVDGQTAGTGANAACGGTTGVLLSSIGAHTVGETAGTNTSLGNYVSVIGGDCAANGTVNLVAGQNAVCTITNSRKAVLIVDKVTVGGGTQVFDFSQTGIANFQLADATTPKKTVDILPGNVTVCELALAVAWDVSVTVNGAPAVPDIDGNTGNACTIVPLAYGDSTTVVFTNTPPPGGGTRTIGYWKNWSSCARGADGDGKQFLKATAPGGIGIQYTLDGNIGAGSFVYPFGLIESFTCEEAVQILSKNAKNGDKRAGDPIYNMTAQLLGAKLNINAQAGTCAALQTAFGQAQTLLVAIGFDGLGSYAGKNPTYTLSAQQKSQAQALAGVFGSYNEGTLGGGCPTHV